MNNDGIGVFGIAAGVFLGLTLYHNPGILDWMFGSGVVAAALGGLGYGAYWLWKRVHTINRAATDRISNDSASGRELAKT